MTKAEVLQAWNVITAVINSSNLWSNNRQEAEQAASLLREAALKSIPGDPVGLCDTDITAITSFELSGVPKGNIIILTDANNVGIQVYKIQTTTAATILKFASNTLLKGKPF